MQYIRELKKYYWPKSPEDASRILAQEQDAAIIAGGTDLLVATPQSKPVLNLVDVTRIGLGYVKKDKKSIRIGATTTMSEIQHNNHLIDFAGGLLPASAGSFVSVQIRNVATIGGNISAAWPSSDLIPALLVLNAKFYSMGKEKKEYSSENFFISKRQTALGAHEMITEIELPVPSPDQKIGYSFMKFGRTEMDIAIVNGAASVEIEGPRKIRCVRLAVGSAAPKVVRCLEIENALAGREMTRELLSSACDNITRSIDPKSDVRATAKYRGRIARVLAARLIEDAFVKAGGKF